jgi:DNA polymerase III alpha subunit (gram-positive type)
MKLCFLDFEATDKDVNTARITQISFSVYDQQTAKELYHYSDLILPDGDYEINETAQTITGISKEQLSTYGKSLRYALDVFHSNLGNVDYLIAHNLHQYDLPLYRNECKRLELADYELPALIDTRFDVPWPEHIDTRKLVYLGAEFGVVNPSAHSARHDVDLMAMLFFKFPFESIVERSKSPMVWIRANVSYDNREKAKARRFMWDGTNKWWVKQLKQCDIEKQEFDFPTIILKDYKGL